MSAETELAELHKDLKPFVRPSGVLTGAKTLHHPLVIELMLVDPIVDHTNKLYLQKLEGLVEAVNKKDYKTYIWLHERPYRLEAFMRIQNELKDPEYWRLLGDVLIDSENAHEFKSEWLQLLNSKRKSSIAMMRPDDFTVYSALSNRLKIYRGFRNIHFKKGLSWTLSKDKAKWFATRFGANGKVTTKVVSKYHILAYLDRRGEQEILLRPDRVYGTTI
jgi:hypothetical protein